jgi:hypothetical protein
MADFIITYHGGEKPKTPQQGAAHMKKWKQWVDDLAEAMVNPGTPVGKTVAVRAAGVSPDDVENAMSGYSIISADDMDAALKIVCSCPFLATGGTVQVSPLMKMGG